MHPSRFIPRLTVRRLMIAVAFGAVVLWGVALWRNAEHYRWKIRHHRMMERSKVVRIVEGGGPISGDELDRVNRIRTAYHTTMRMKYERAAAKPWLYVSPDEPEPFTYSEPGRVVDLNFGP